jgi:ABC-type branched-subunit amino acid transport system ATPase component
VTDVVLEARGISKSFAGLTVLHDISLSVRKGERRGIIGANGAGKTTLFNVLGGSLPPTKGQVLFQGRDVTGKSVAQRSRMGLGRTFQIVALLDDLTVRENVLLGLSCSRRWEWRAFRPMTGYSDLQDEAEELLQRSGLWELRDSCVGALAYGHQRILEIVMALTNRTSVLLLDEPAAGLSGEETIRLMRMLNGLDPELTLVLIEHDMEVMFQSVDTVTVLDSGSVLMEGSVDDVRSSAVVHERYLGTTPGA